jgi:hypothetical protein
VHGAAVGVGSSSVEIQVAGGSPSTAASGDSTSTLSPHGTGYHLTPVQLLDAREGPAVTLPSIGSELTAAAVGASPAASSATPVQGAGVQPTAAASEGLYTAAVSPEW